MEVVLLAVHHHRVSGVIPTLQVQPQDSWRRTTSQYHVNTNTVPKETPAGHPIPGSCTTLTGCSWPSHISSCWECDLSLAQWVGLSSLHTGLSQSTQQQLLAGYACRCPSLCKPAGLTCLYYLLKMVSTSALEGDTQHFNKDRKRSRCLWCNKS